ncbi:MAG: Holliday junction resolvase RuvX [Tannerella sp.]|jgi:putative Holliday junction resolvase|nr:Holliday junction resolvase RuvX [Tannerella sp.]
MGRIMAIDYGRKRTGLAVTDTMQLIAGGLTTVPSGEAVDYIKAYTSQDKVDLFVVGEPKQMNNEPSENMHYVKAFVNRLHKVIPDIPIEYFDERFTSVMAHKAMIEGGLKKKKRQNKALADEISATLILQGYMEKRRSNL